MNNIINLEEKSFHEFNSAYQKLIFNKFDCWLKWFNETDVFNATAVDGQSIMGQLGRWCDLYYDTLAHIEAYPFSTVSKYLEKQFPQLIFSAVYPIVPLLINLSNEELSDILLKNHTHFDGFVFVTYNKNIGFLVFYNE